MCCEAVVGSVVILFIYLVFLARNLNSRRTRNEKNWRQKSAPEGGIGFLGVCYIMGLRFETESLSNREP